MLIIFHIMLILKIGRCTDDHIFETKTVGLGQNVTLTCTRQKTWYSTSLFWIRHFSGTFPEILGGTLSYELEDVEKTHHITTKQESGAYILHIPKTQLSDTAIYYCIKVQKRQMTFLRGILLRIKGPEPDVSAIIQAPPSDPVRPGDFVTLQCSVLSDPENKTCPGEHSVYWFRAGSDQSHPSLIYAHGNSGDECEENLEAHSPQKCVYNFARRNVSSSDAGTYYCAVATCGEILFGNGTKLDIQVDSWSNSQTGSIFLYGVCAALALSLIVIAILVYAIRRKSCDCCSAAVTLQIDAARGNQNNENNLVYAMPAFPKMKVCKSGRRSATAKEETIYTDVRASVID